MKKKNITNIRNMIAILLAAVMCFTMIPSAAFADEGDTDDEKRLVVFGASTANGYGHVDYSGTDKGFNVKNNELDTWTIDDAKENSMGRMSVQAYPWQFKKYLEETENTSYYLSSFAMNGMRTNELHALLDEDYYEKAFNQERDKGVWYYEENEAGEKVLKATGFLGDHINDFVMALGHGGATVEENGKEVPVWTSEDNITIDGLTGIYGLEGTSGEAYFRAQKYVKEEIKNADIIIVDNVMNNFGTYFANRIAGAAGVPGKEAESTYSKQTLDDIDEILGTDWKQINKIKNVLLKAAGLSSNPIGKEMIDGFLYCYADATANFSAEMDIIKKLNPDAKIIVVGPYNSLEGVKLNLGGQVIDLGTVMGKAFDAVSLYLRALDKHCDEYYFADLSMSIETFMTKIAESDSFEEFVEDEEGKTLLDDMYSGSAQSFLEMFMGTSDPELLPDVIAASVFDGLVEDEEPESGMMAVLWKLKYTVLNQYVVLLKESEKDTSSKDLTWKDMHTIIDMEDDVLSERLEELEDEYSAEDIKESLIGFTTLLISGIKDMIPQIKPVVQKLMFEAAHYDTLDLTAIAGAMQDMKAVKGELMNLMTDPEAKPSDQLLGIFHILDRFILYSSVGQHPDAKGCEQIFEQVAEAYHKEQTAYPEAKQEAAEELSEMLDQLREMLKGTPEGDDLEKAIEMLEKIDAALPMIDEGTEMLEQYKTIKEQFFKYYAETLDLLGITEEDLIEAGEKIDVEQIADWIKRMDQIVRQYPELREKYEPQIREYAEKIYEIVNTAMDEIIKAKDRIDADKIAEYIQTVEEIIDKIRDIAKDAPTEEEILEKLKELQKIVEEKVQEISKELYEQLNAINEKIKEVVDGKDYEQIMEELKPIMDQIKELGVAVYQLPEYEKIIDSYTEIIEKLGVDSAELLDDVEGLRQEVDELQRLCDDKKVRIAKLRAKAVDASIKTSVKFPKNTVTVTASWEKDADATGYELKVNGKAAEFKETDAGFVYTDTAAKIGTSYKFEVTPYVEYEGEKYSGKTFKASVVPKVKLKKGAVKKLKTAGTQAVKVKWKKVSGASGYKISYKLGKKTKYKTVKSGKKVSLKIRKLASGKKYTVKVRAWKKVNGKKYYGKWSKAKKIVVK